MKEKYGISSAAKTHHAVQPWTSFLSKYGRLGWIVEFENITLTKNNYVACE